MLYEKTMATLKSREYTSQLLNPPIILSPVSYTHLDVYKRQKEQYLSLVDKIKTAIPDISLTTDIIVGFPGETEEDFEETMDVVRKVRYDSAFTFIYSCLLYTSCAKPTRRPWS